MRSRIVSHPRAAVVLAAVLCFIQQAAQACEGCKQQIAMGDGAGGSRTVNLIGVGYGVSILFLLFMVAAIVSGLGYMAYKNCQAIAARQRAMMEAEDAAEGFAGGLSA